MLSGNSHRQTVHTHRASVHQAAKLVAALLRVASVTAGLAESNGNLPPGLWLTLPAGWLPRTGISSVTLCSVIEYGLPLLCYHGVVERNRISSLQSHGKALEKECCLPWSIDLLIFITVLSFISVIVVSCGSCWSVLDVSVWELIQGLVYSVLSIVS